MTRKMKDSGVDWIGEIPEDWEVIRLKNMIGFYSGYAFKENELSGSGDKFVLRIGNIQNNKLSINSDTLKTNLNETTLKNQKVLNEDILIAMSGATVGKIVYIEQTVKRLYINQRVGIIRSPLNHLLKYYFLINGFREYIFLNSQGSAQPNISETEILNYMISLPPKSQQKSIADFLDKKVSEIDNIIFKTKKAIEEYKRYKQSLITETVTKGLDKNVEMKDSGIEWIGEIPEHWDVIRLGFLGRLQNGINKAGEEFGFGYPFINYGDIYRNYQLDKSEFSGLVNSTEKERENYSVKKGDVLFTRTSEIKEEIGYAATCLENIEGAVFTGFAIRFRPFKKSRLYPGFSKYYFRSEIHRKYFVKEMNIVTRVSLGQELLMKLSVLLPPLKEQEQIASYLDKKCSQIDQIISSKEKLLIEIEAYKKSLIYETVTGKREVE